MSSPIVAPVHEPTTGGQVIMLFVFGCSFVVLAIWQVLIYLSPYFPALLPRRAALVAAEEGDGEDKEKERRELSVALDQPSTWASLLHSEGTAPTIFLSLLVLLLMRHYYILYRLVAHL